MRYLSTRGEAPVLGFSDALLAGLARDGGLYVPVEWPHFSAADIRAMRGLSYAELAIRVLTPYLGGEIDQATFGRIVREAYETPDLVRSAPHRQAIRKVKGDVLDDPARWAMTWRAYRRKHHR